TEAAGAPTGLPAASRATTALVKVVAGLPMATVAVFDVSGGAGWPSIVSTPVAVAVLVKVPAVAKVRVQVNVQVSPGSRMLFALASPPWRVRGAHAPVPVSVTTTLEMGSLPVFDSV